MEGVAWPEDQEKEVPVGEMACIWISLPAQEVSGAKMVICGLGLTITDSEVAAEHPFAEVTVTV